MKVLWEYKSYWCKSLTGGDLLWEDVLQEDVLQEEGIFFMKKNSYWKKCFIEGHFIWEELSYVSELWPSFSLNPYSDN